MPATQGEGARDEHHTAAGVQEGGNGSRDKCLPRRRRCRGARPGRSHGRWGRAGKEVFGREEEKEMEQKMIEGRKERRWRGKEK